MNWFVIVALFILSLLFAFLGFRITGIGFNSWWIAAALVGIILFYPLVWYGVLSETPDQVVRAIVHSDMGFLSLMLAQIVLRDLVFVPLRLIEPESSCVVFAFSQTTTFAMMALSSAFLIFGYLKAKRGPRIVQIEIPIAGLPVDLEGFRIVQISDLHAGAGISQAYVKNVVEMALPLKPDVFALTGDIADGSFEKYQTRLEPLTLLIKHAPVLYIVGNHEFLLESDLWIREFKRLGARVLLNEHTTLVKGQSSILFAGVLDPSVKEVDPTKSPSIEKSLEGSDPAPIKVLLAHRPNIAKEACERFDLQISGHTHGGQFFPWNLLIKIIQPYATGLHKFGKMWVYTNPGAGFWGPPLRIGTTSEISVLTLRAL